MRNFPNKTRIQDNRYWWFRLKQTGYLPDVLQILTPREKKALKKWFDWIGCQDLNDFPAGKFAEAKKDLETRMAAKKSVE